MSRVQLTPGLGALLLDLDGVLRLWPAERDRNLEERYAVPEGTLSRYAFRPDLVATLTTGRITHAEWMAAVAADLTGCCPKAVELLAEWQRSPGVVNAGTLELSREVRVNRIPVVLVTNGTDRLRSDLVELGLLSEVDAVVNSWDIGVRKPDRSIYLAAADIADVPPAECLFVDDTLDNIAAATKLGMRAVHFTGVEALRAALS